jgi:hypothetical protein
MRIWISDQEHITDLRNTLRRAGCIAVQNGPTTLDVAVPDAPTSAQEAREVRAYLRAWTAAHGVETDVFGDPDGDVSPS